MLSAALVGGAEAAGDPVEATGTAALGGMEAADLAFVGGAVESLLRLARPEREPLLAVRVKAAWALANLCDGQIAATNWLLASTAATAGMALGDGLRGAQQESSKPPEFVIPYLGTPSRAQTLVDQHIRVLSTESPNQKVGLF